MTKKVLLINGSPRKNGLSSSLLGVLNDHLIKKAEMQQIILKSEIIHLADYDIQHCTGCDACLRKPHTCPLSENDDMLKLEELLTSSDAIIVGAPSYFGSIPAIVKDIIDRSRPMKMAKYRLKDKFFSVVATSGLKDGGTGWIFDNLMHWAIIQGMIVIGALGHPVLMNNIPTESLQMSGLKEFRKPSEPGDLSKLLAENLAERITELLK